MQKPFSARADKSHAGKPIRFGLAHLPWNDNDNGWALPGGDIISGNNPARAFLIVQRLHRLMFMKPGMYSAKAAQMSTAEKVADAA